MSMTVYAAKTDADDTWGPVFDWSCANAEILADDPDGRMDRGEDPFIENPDYVEGAFLDMANGNAEFLFKTLGFQLPDGEPQHFPIDDINAAAIRGLNGPAAWAERPTVTHEGPGPVIVDCGLPAERMRHYLTTLVSMTYQGRLKGATHIVVC